MNTGKKHVLLVSDRFPPTVGGIQAAAGELASAFARMGFRVSVATATPQASSCSEYGVFHVAPEIFGAGVVDLAERLRPDVMVLNGHTPQTKYPVPVNGTDVPFVFRSHGIATNFKIYWNRPPFFGFVSWLKRVFRAFCNAVEGRRLSQEVFLDGKKGFFQNFDVTLASVFHPRNVSFIPNAFESLSNSGVNDFRTRFGLDSAKPVFLCVANYCDRKGQVDAVRIIRRHPELDAWFVFVGSERNDTLDRVERLAGGDDRIRFLHGIARSDVVDAINDCDAAFLFARQEQQPLFLLEAMSCGKPWFCTDVGSVSKMKGGIVLRRRNERSFVDAVKTLLSADIRRTLGAEGRAFWEVNYSPNVVYARWKRLLDDVIAGRAKSGY